jgi:AraC-like DNA-binding protein
MSYKDIPLVQTSVLEPFVLLARKIGVSVERELESVGLPPEILDGKQLLVLEKPAWKFVRAIAYKEALPLFGLQASFLLAHQEIATIKPLVRGCSNLLALLKRFCQIAPLQTNIADYALEEQDDVLWFVNRGIHLTTDYAQVELFQVAGMIQLVQIFAGTQWRPEEIHFSFESHKYSEQAKELQPSRILYSQKYPAIAVPRVLLPLNRPLQENSVMDSSHIVPPPVALKDQLVQALVPYLGASKINSNFLSRITDMNIRTLQRRLGQSNTSYSEILDEARFLRARYLLEHSDEKLMEISLMLGYENASTFSRAFKRWAGVSPREFRKYCAK